MSLHVINLPEPTHSVGTPREKRGEDGRGEENRKLSGEKKERVLLGNFWWVQVEDS